jgi:hypothetical protein
MPSGSFTSMASWIVEPRFSKTMCRSPADSLAGAVKPESVAMILKGAAGRVIGWTSAAGPALDAAAQAQPQAANQRTQTTGAFMTPPVRASVPPPGWEKQTGSRPAPE